MLVCVLGAAVEVVGSDPIADLLLDKALLSRSIDAVVTNRMAQGHVPGVIVTLVHGDRIVFRRGPENRITHLFGLFSPFGVFQRIADPAVPPAK